ncbi:MAG: SAM-dependent methyltransferase [Acidimicrobiia bacterium]|nr:SAM-dependent methyltransferase [Acidimicrobiia bacterium]
MTSYWVRWHQAYDDPANMNSRRLEAVVAMLAGVFATAPGGPIRVLSLCSGDGRDLSGALAGHPRAGDVTGVLVEADPELAAGAAANLAVVAPGFAVRCADAGDPASFADQLPADVLLLCGIFGNVAPTDIAATVAAVPALASPGAAVLWTRHRRHPDITSWIRQRFHDAGCPAAAWVSPGYGGFALGLQRVGPHATPEPVPARLFTFTTTAGEWGAQAGAGRPA